MNLLLLGVILGMMNNIMRVMKFVKYIVLSIASVSLLAMLNSCSTNSLDDNITPQKSITTIKAHQEGDGTKATYDGRDIQWDDNDALSVFPEGSSVSVKFDKKSGDDDSFTYDGDIDINNIYALFPYNSSATIANGQISTIIKTTQTATPWSFAPDANVAVGFSEEGNEVMFKNAVSYIKISYKTTVSEIDIKKLTFKSLDENVLLSGNVVLTPTLSNGVVSDVSTDVVSEGKNYVELTGDLLPDTDYYLVVAPTTLSGGFKIIFTDALGNEFSKEYTADKNKAQLQRNYISPTGVKNLDNYTIDVEAYWRVLSADEFTGDNDKYLLVKNTSSSSTGYRIFDESKTDVFISSGSPLMDKFAIAGYSSMNSIAKLFALANLKNKLSSWQSGGSAPVMMSHYVLYCFRQAYSDNGLEFSSTDYIFNTEDKYAFTVNSNSSQNNEVSFKLWYTYSGNHLSKDVILTNCYLEADADHSFKLCGRIAQESIDGLIDVFFLGKGSDFNRVLSPSDLHPGADRAVDEDTKIGYCATEVTTVDGTKMNNCFMIKNSKLCNTPEPESIWIYKKGIKQIPLIEYVNY